MWQLARTLKVHSEYPKAAVGKYVWTDSEAQEPCGMGCTIPSIGVNYTNGTGLFELKCVMHLDALELQHVFAADVEWTTHDRWLTMTNEEILAMRIDKATS